MSTRRKTISAQASALQYEPIKEPASMPRKRKASIIDDLMSTPAPPPRSKPRLPSSPKSKRGQKQSFTGSPVVNHHSTPHLSQPGPTHYIDPWQYHPPPYISPYPQYQQPFHAQPQPLVYMPQHRPHTPAAPPPPPPKIVDPETISQQITSTYDEYRWPVALYELEAGPGFDFAESWLQDQLGKGVYHSDSNRWDAHSTAGFIKNGNRMSLLVLHNAANPFQYDPPATSTTSIGVYGLFAHEHNEIHWTTIAPGVSKWFTLCMNAGFLTLKQKWSPNMKASDKRFHRAYWLAANKLPLNRILNHNAAPETPYGVFEDSEKDKFVIAEQDLQHGWDGESVSVEESKKIWERIVDEMEGMDLADVEHVSIGGSERAFMAD
ncbi:hypothetical protein J4E93_003108 [Alternaria ventricosa]|uniref:uncharacterized protein n=1 Tax=Alternaria ventricosa TaxID=1187951 RepID=UPI0020C4E2FD|nr:uncharacterized protein J4E93_003108 [Alternaria ventricosa]KAI4650751.1 hypothetical protein J4E93_003108 [Alternaria ventricosa]